MKSSPKNYSFTIEVDKRVDRKKPKRNNKPVLSSSCLQVKKKPTGSEIEEKIKLAELRRKNGIELRVAKTIREREKMQAFALKMDKLRLHHVVMENDKANNGKTKKNDGILTKKEYVKLASELSMEFETCAEKLNEDIKIAENLQV